MYTKLHDNSRDTYYVYNLTCIAVYIPLTMRATKNMDPHLAFHVTVLIFIKCKLSREFVKKL